MIKNFTSLAANERTYLSWVRTAIAMMAFGFLIEKFELFLKLLGAELKTKVDIQASGYIEAIGIAMMTVSVFIMIGAAIRYFIQRKNIMSENPEVGFDNKISFLLVVFLVSISLFLIGYVAIRLIF